MFRVLQVKRGKELNVREVLWTVGRRNAREEMGHPTLGDLEDHMHTGNDNTCRMGKDQEHAYTTV